MSRLTPSILFLKAILLFVCVGIQEAQAREVSLVLVTPGQGSFEELEGRQELWKSAYGGWVVSGWPYEVRVGQTPVFALESAQERLQEKLDPQTKKTPVPEDLLNQIKGKPVPSGAALDGVQTLRRRSEVVLELDPGGHTVRPFGLEFSLGADGVLASKDTRLRVDSRAGRVEVICHPVNIKLFTNGQSVSGAVRLSCGTSVLTGGLENHIVEFEKQNAGLLGGADGKGLRRVTMYLPASASGVPYEVNGVGFTVADDGTVRLLQTDSARVVGKEIQLPAAHVEMPEAPVGVSWYGAVGKTTLGSRSRSMELVSESGSAWFPVERDRTVGAGRVPGDFSLKLGAQPVRLPERDARRPHELVLWDVSASAAWCVATAPLALPSGEMWSCRITPLTKDPAKLPKTLGVRLEAEPGGEVGGEFVLRSEDGLVFEGRPPARSGLWKVSVVEESPFWAGRRLGLVRIGGKGARQAVSFYTEKNRAVARRGDGVTVFWTLKRPVAAGAADWPVVLKGDGLEQEVGRILVPARAALGEAGALDAQDFVSGSLLLDTGDLAPGAYSVSIHAEDTDAYPARLQICQREPVSDFELYTHVYGDSKPYAGSPVTGYQGNVPGGPGLEPFLADGDGSMPALFAGYATAPGGPALEKFTQPAAEELKFMALARLGMSAAPSPPSMLHHEEWNPKHTLPEELAQLRRRLALFAQARADVPGFDGIALGWFATLNGYWEESPALDGHQKRRNAAAAAWVAERVAEARADGAGRGFSEEQLKTQEFWAGLGARSSVLPSAFGEYLADVREMLPRVNAYNAIPSFWLGGAHSYPPNAFSTLTRRDAVDYTDYCLPPWGNFRAPAFLAMGNKGRQKTRCEFFTHNNRSEHFATSFAAAGRGLDGFSLTSASEDLLRIFQRYGSWFSAHEPLADVAVYFGGWNHQASVILHDLARMRRPGMLVSREEVLAGELSRYKVLFFAGGGMESPEVLGAMRKFQKSGGVVIKDALCRADLPGRTLRFGYDKEQVHSGWGLGGPNGEWEFAHLWKNFKETRQKPLEAAFAGTVQPPVGTPDEGVVISPLAGRESILCFVVNQTPVPLEVAGRWRQMFVLPRVGELQVAAGWHVRDVLAGKPVQVRATPAGLAVPVDFTRAEGALFLLTRKEPAGMAMQSRRTSPNRMLLNAWLSDLQEVPLPDAMPFEVTLETGDGRQLFHKFAALSRDLSLEVPVPALSGGAPLRLRVRDLILGGEAVEVLAAAVPGGPAAEGAQIRGAFVGGEQPVAAFLDVRRGPVTILLDEGQEAFAPAAERLAALCRERGREARVVVFEPDQVRPLPLRWNPLAGDVEVLEKARAGMGFVSRVGLSSVSRPDLKTGKMNVFFDDPKSGYDEYGPRLRHDRDVVLFGTPGSHRVVGELAPYLRRLPSESQPSAGGFFVQYLWSPLQGGFDGIYVACRDAQGAERAVERLAGCRAGGVEAASGEAVVAGDPVLTRGGTAQPLENLVEGKFGSAVLNVAFAPDGSRIFVTTAAMGDSLFALSSGGEVLARASRYIGRGNFWAPYSGHLEALDANTVNVGVGDTVYRYSFEKGWLNRVPVPAHGLVAPFSVPVGASTLLRDAPRQVTFLGGPRRLHALDVAGRPLWEFDDTLVHSSPADLQYPRSLFPRGVSADGRVLLASGFAIKHDVYARGTVVNASVFGLEAATGKLLWQREGWLLNQGKVVATTERFLVIDDAGEVQLVDALRGETLSRLASVSAADWMLPVPSSERLLIVDNKAFDRAGPACRVFLRSVGGGPDRVLPVVGRVTDVLPAPDGQAVYCVSTKGVLEKYRIDGTRVWQAQTPGGGIVRLSPDARTVFVGARDGRLFWINAAEGKIERSTDFNPFNTTEPDKFVKQLDSAGDVPLDLSTSAPAGVPEASYRKTLEGSGVQFDANLVAPEQLRRIMEPASPEKGGAAGVPGAGRVSPEAALTVQVSAGRTYLVELLAGVASPDKRTAHTRLELVVAGKKTTGNLPYRSLLPLSGDLVRRRAAFRADETGAVTLTLRAVEPRSDATAGKEPVLTYEGAGPSGAGLVASELVVSAMNFGGRNLVYDGAARATLERDASRNASSRSQPQFTPGGAPQSRPAGDLTCLVMPWTGGNSAVRNEPYPCPLTALRLVDGIIANQETAWTTQARGPAIDRAECRIRFKTPQKLRAIALYEDNAAPLAEANGVRERISQRFGVYVRMAGSRQWTPAGVITDNQQLVNIFASPPGPVEELLYFWAGRNDTRKTDGLVRMAELEVYSADDFSGMLGDGVENLLEDAPGSARKKK